MYKITMRLCAGVVLSACLPFATPALAWFEDFDLAFSGVLRADAAFKTTDDENIYNQYGNPFNGVEVERCGGVPPTAACTTPDTVVRDGKRADNDFNLMQLRSELSFDFNFTSNIKGAVRVRGIYELGKYDNFDPADVGSEAVGYLYGEPNFFEYDDFDTGGSQNRLEWAGRHYMVDLPSAYLDYQNGPLLVRAGNQQIAWGQALFFRVLDVPNGLDLRRHLILDYAPEEYADERVASPAIRASYQITDDWDIESFAQMFQPTIYPNPNTPYNVIASQFTIHDTYDQVDDEINYGVRLRGRLGDFGLQFVFADRMNPDGTFRWTASNVNRGLPGELPNIIPGVTEPIDDLLQTLLGLVGGVPASGAILAQTPFEVDPTGVLSATEWFTFAGAARLNGVTGLNAAIDEYPASRLLLAAPVDSYEAASRELDLFFQLSGGLRGHLAREYHREQNYGLGASYVVFAEPGSLFDQLIINLEVLYTPDRKFTNPSLSRNYLEKDEWIGALVMEKYHRFSQAFPATYLVFQWMHRTESDLYGRHLSGMGGDASREAPGQSDGSNYLVFAFQQPFPNLVWRADFAALYDVKGGLLTQAGLRWKPSGAIAVEGFYTFLKGDMGSTDNQDIISTIDWADEIGLRIGYQF
ncbi:MAG: hypothetical protein PHP86_17130 [Nevskiales bacterium]|nr:hypothetical protein [Nevskiales bacterium]